MGGQRSLLNVGESLSERDVRNPVSSRAKLPREVILLQCGLATVATIEKFFNFLESQKSASSVGDFSNEEWFSRAWKFGNGEFVWAIAPSVLPAVGFF
jgi:hypothetical protein